jgi:peptidase E
MRMRVNRLVYMLMGAALLVGLLVSGFVRAEPTLTAAEDCYGLCSSVTALSLSSSTVAYGNQQVEKFRVKVRAGTPGTGGPAGYVVVESGTKFLCAIYLHRGMGSCSPVTKALKLGPHQIVAHYSGNKNFKPSTSNPETLTVLRYTSLRNPSVTALSLSSSTVSYGNQQVEKFRVKVRAGTPGTGGPAGYVVVESGKKILCSIYLHRGMGSCSPVTKALKLGPHQIVAHYSGNKNFKPSTSNPETLTVLT